MLNWSEHVKSLKKIGNSLRLSISHEYMDVSSNGAELI